MTPTTKLQAGVLPDTLIDNIVADNYVSGTRKNMRVIARAIEAEVLRRATLTPSGASQQAAPDASRQTPHELANLIQVRAFQCREAAAGQTPGNTADLIAHKEAAAYEAAANIVRQTEITSGVSQSEPVAWLAPNDNFGEPGEQRYLVIADDAHPAIRGLVEAFPVFGAPQAGASQQTAPESADMLWCETCQGGGTIDERLGGYSFSNPAAECPDCDGKGWWRRAAPQAAPVDPADVHVDPAASLSGGLSGAAAGGSGK